MSQLAKAASWLGQVMAEHNSSASDEDRTVYYLRGTHRIEISATPGESDIEVLDEQGQLTIERTRDFKVNTSELVADGQSFEPSVDDRVLEETTSGTKKTNELYDIVAMPGHGTFTWADHHHTRMRIFTRRRTKTVSEITP